jgi:hypothetical protein
MTATYYVVLLSFFFQIILVWNKLQNICYVGLISLSVIVDAFTKQLTAH